MTRLLQKELYHQLSWNRGTPGVFSAQATRQWLGVLTANETGVVEPEEAAEPEVAAEPEAKAMVIGEDIEN